LANDVTGPMHALTAWDLNFQVCLGYTFTPATLHNIYSWSTYPWSRCFLFVGFTTLTHELLIFRHVFRLQADAVQVEPELAAVTLDPVNL